MGRKRSGEGRLSWGLEQRQPTKRPRGGAGLGEALARGRLTLSQPLTRGRRHRAHIVPPRYATPAETEPHSPLRTPVLLGQGAGECARVGMRALWLLLQ